MRNDSGAIVFAAANSLLAFGAPSIVPFLRRVIGNGVFPVGKGKYGFNGTSLRCMRCITKGESPNRDDDSSEEDDFIVALTYD